MTKVSTFRILAAGLLGAIAALAQTTQGLISGQLIDNVTGRPIAAASVLYESAVSNLAGASMSDSSGYYYLPLLSPGFYRVRVTAPAYQSQEVQELELTVAARVELNFRLRPLNDVWESGEYKSVFLPGTKTIVTFYGPDVDPSKSGSFEATKGRRESLESTVSEVIDSDEINNLPLSGRDVYAMLVTLPGVTSDAATGRGLGLSINGQRPSSSNFLLDGLENNNYLITGPLTALAPEAIQEYRVSINNFSAEFGRTSGFIANAITRTGSDQFHGDAYFYLQNDALNADSFQRNLASQARTPDHQSEPGFVLGGPILRNRLYFSSAYDYFRSGSQADPYTYLFPTPSFLTEFTAPNSLARQLLTEFPTPAPASSPGLTAQMTLAAPVAIQRTQAIQRFDYTTPDGKDHATARLLVNQLDEPDFIWSPYKDFISSLHEYTWALGASETHSFRTTLTNEARFSVSDDNLHWNRPHPEIPTLATSDVYFVNGQAQTGVTLPGSPAFYDYKNDNKSWELLDNLIWTHGQHLVTTGAGVLLRSSNGYLTAGQGGEYLFNNIITFALGDPSYFRAAIDRADLPGVVQEPDYNRSYRYNQYYLFAQDTYKLTSRLTVNYGARYEYYGGPENVGPAKDDLIQLGAGSTLAQQLVGATISLPSSTGNEQLFAADTGDFAVRAGASYDIFGTGRTLLRGGFGTFYDRPFDNLWENERDNNLILPLLSLPPGQTNYLAPVTKELASFQGQTFASDFPDLTLVDPKLRNGYVKSYFAGVQHRFTDNFTLDVNGLGSYGRRLVTTDIINRDFSTPTGRYNPDLPDIAYRANQGFSDYNALTAVVKYRFTGGLVQGSYTWSHSIDNQSDPLIGDFFNLDFTSIAGAGASTGRSAFSEQFSPQVDRGNSDYDQRHNFVVFSYWTLPAPFARSKWGLPLRGWMVSEIAAFRSGFPYTVTGTSTVVPGGGQILNNRVNILNPNETLLPNPVPVAGGQLILNAADFTEAAPSTLGNEGRNAFIGPGFYNIDVSVARYFPLRWLGEAGRLRFRAEFFNVLNHANLGNPDSLFTNPLTSTFGIATYGRQGVQSGFPAVTPLNESPRQIQMSVKVEF